MRCLTSAIKYNNAVAARENNFQASQLTSNQKATHDIAIFLCIVNQKQSRKAEKSPKIM